MVQLFRCKICGDPYIGMHAPSRCPFCGAYGKFIVEAKDYNETFDVDLNETDRKNAEIALDLEIGNAAFYYCASEKTDDAEGKQLFKALGKVEAEHASIWRKILKVPKEKIEASLQCAIANNDNLKESHDREEKAIEHYKKFAEEAENQRVKTLFLAIVEVEEDHLKLSEDRMN